MKTKKLLISILTLLLLTSCLEAVKHNELGTQVDDVLGGGTGTNCTVGDCATGGDGGIDGDSTVIPKVEIRHLIEPKVDEFSEGAGSYKRKLTIPKNYNGKLYLAGINISTLAAQSISVRFNFGKDSNPFILPATVSTGEGLTPQTNVEVLVMDMRAKPFEDINLIYDLFDYNDYDFDGSGNDDNALSEPVDNNRNDKLYCRGLSLAHDPTFDGSLADQCSAGDDICKYAYAKVVDKGLVFDSTATGSLESIIPNALNISSGSDGYFEDSDSIKLGRCLPDKMPSTYTYDETPTIFSLDTIATSPGAVVIEDVNYYYRGPYQPISYDKWEIRLDAITGVNGIFGGLDNSGDINFGFNSKLFPLYTKRDLPSGVEYLGSTLPNGEKVLKTTLSNTESEWMDGCNERLTVHEVTGEHIGSCNVTATIEIIAKDDDGKETIVDITNEVKLQLVSPVEIDSNGEDVLLSSFKQCSSSNQCGSDSCCINSRCWDKEIVGQCIEDLPSYGDQVTGASCSSDYECASLCCDKEGSGTCRAHDTNSVNPSYCGKSSGQTCVSQEWCQKHPVTTCAIVRTGTDSVGGTTCAVRCITAEVYGECTVGNGQNVGICTSPCQPTPPVFNPSDPNRCSDENVIEYDQLVELANNPVCG